MRSGATSGGTLSWVPRMSTDAQAPSIRVNSVSLLVRLHLSGFVDMNCRGVCRRAADRVGYTNHP